MAIPSNLLRRAKITAPAVSLRASNSAIKFATEYFIEIYA
jgi:hypothetical protein